MSDDTPACTLTPPRVSYEVRTKTWTLAEEFVWCGKGITLRIPEGFETDLASVPRPLWGLIAPHELSPLAAIVHDWLYRTGGGFGVVTRAQADSLFYEIMRNEGVSWFKAKSAYLAVRAFGGGSWQKVPA